MRPRLLALALALVLATTAAGSTRVGVATLPGAGPFTPALARRIDAGLRAKGKDYKPRTRHLRPDGSPVYTNRLILESSPYLLQHAHNPVNWYPWGDAAFDAARRLHRPVILSVGYSTCHWCHVMERESFEDEEIARYLNENYILIKVDREERPDIDGVYLMAVAMMTGSGGWPMTVWLTPDREPFFGGTYFPPRDGARGARTGFLTIAKRLKAAWDVNGVQVEARAGQIAEVIRRASAPPPATKLPGEKALMAAEAHFAESYDPVHGGFGRAPKFPEPAALDLLLRLWRRTGDARPLRMSERTLERMAAGGVRDQIGGGFHRYATDAAWQVPHFEKMLYDQAQLAVVYLEGWQATGREAFAEVSRGILDEMLREMRSPEGGFYAAVDADSPGGEGKYYVWTPEEIDRVLGSVRGKFIRAYYGVRPEGNFEGANILHVASGLREAAKVAGIPAARSKETLRASREALRAARSKRPPPATDTKVIAAWNGLMVSALARAGLALRDDRYTREAERTADFLLTRMEREGRLKRVWKDGRARVDGTLEDHAFLAAGLLDLFEATSDPRWLQAAKRLMAALDARFADRARGGYFLTAADAEHLIAREKSDDDGAIPSGNAVAAMNELRLSEFTSDDVWRRRADATIRGASAILDRHAGAAPAMLAAVDFRDSLPKEIVIATPARDGAEPLLTVLGKGFVPNRVLVIVTPETARVLAREVPLAEGKTAAGGRPTAYVCERGVCALPTSDPAVFAKQLVKPAGKGITR